MACSLSLAVLFLCSIFFKYSSLTELPDIRDRMSDELKTDYRLYGVVLTAISFACVLGVLVVSFCMLLVQIALKRARMKAEAREAKARRLRRKADNMDVRASAVLDKHFH